jgi:hypothetical protein
VDIYTYNIFMLWCGLMRCCLGYVHCSVDRKFMIPDEGRSKILLNYITHMTYVICHMSYVMTYDIKYDI